MHHYMVSSSTPLLYHESIFLIEGFPCHSFPLLLMCDSPRDWFGILMFAVLHNLLAEFCMASLSILGFREYLQYY